MDKFFFWIKTTWESIRMLVLGVFVCIAGIVIGISSSSLFFFSNVEEARMERWLHMIIPAAGLIGSVILAGYLITRLIAKQVAQGLEKREMEKEKSELETVLRGDAPKKSIGGSRIWFPNPEQPLLTHEEKKIPFLERVPRLSLPWKRKNDEEE